MITHEEFLNAIDIVNNYKKQVTEQFEKMKASLDEEGFSNLIINENTSFYDWNCGLSVKSTNILKSAGYEKVGDLKELKKTDLLKFRGLGKVGFNEIEKFLLQAGIVLVG